VHWPSSSPPWCLFIDSEGGEWRPQWGTWCVNWACCQTLFRSSVLLFRGRMDICKLKRVRGSSCCNCLAASPEMFGQLRIGKKHGPFWCKNSAVALAVAWGVACLHGLHASAHLRILSPLAQDLSCNHPCPPTAHMQLCKCFLYKPDLSSYELYQHPAKLCTSCNVP
jgi:hypothetical protein